MLITLVITWILPENIYLIFYEKILITTITNSHLLILNRLSRDL